MSSSTRTSLAETFGHTYPEIVPDVSGYMAFVPVEAVAVPS
jgi:hypothetical protein